MTSNECVAKAKTMAQAFTECFSFDLEKTPDKPNANRIWGVLIGSANTQRTRLSSDWTLEHVHLTSCFDLICGFALTNG